MTAVNEAGCATWRLAAGQALLHRGWNGEYVLYNDLTGDTHLLTEPAIRLLLALQQAPRSEAALAALPGLPAAGAQLDTLLSELERLALAECIAC